MSDQSSIPTRIEPRRQPGASLRTVRIGLPMRETEHLIRTLLAAGHSPDGVTGAVCEWIEAIRSPMVDVAKTEPSSGDGTLLRAAIAVWVAHVDASRRTA